MSKFKEKIFWKDGFNGQALSGIMYRSFDLNQFIEDLEKSHNHEVVGITFEGNNLELIVKKEDDGENES
jgi:hypothetical protein